MIELLTILMLPEAAFDVLCQPPELSATSHPAVALTMTGRSKNKLYDYQSTARTTISAVLSAYQMLDPHLRGSPRRYGRNEPDITLPTSQQGFSRHRCH